MSKKKHKPRKKRTDSNHTPLDMLSRSGKTLRSPLVTLPGGVQLTSWVNECIPNILWACILISHLERSECLDLFRSVPINAREKLPEAEYKDSNLVHNFLSLLTARQFDLLFEKVLANAKAKNLLSALLLVKCLPDRAHWERVLDAPNPEVHWQVIARAVGICFYHQSQEATDVRWIKNMHIIIMGKVHFPEMFSEHIEELLLYPDKGDMRSVRSSIRAMELMTRMFEEPDQERATGEEPPPYTLPPQHNEQFWKEMLEETGCYIVEKRTLPVLPLKSIKSEIFGIYHAVSNHFNTTLTHTGIDAKHDAAFGLTLYALTLALNVSMGYGHVLVEGRMVLRSIMEAFVILRYLNFKNDANLWKKYRSDGSGKTKLAFLKHCEAEELPDFIDFPHMEKLANEDMWLEFQDIELGQWAKSDLRTMATECGIKDVYDKYYDWSSGYTHSQWICVRDTVFTVCANPLHRFHRIPVMPKMNMPSVIPDACKIINRMLDELNNLYPSFKPRLKVHTKETITAQSVDQPQAEEPLTS